MAGQNKEQVMAGNGRDGGRHGNHWRIVVWIGAALILLLPLVAMQFTEEVNWNVADFAFAATLIIGTGLTYELAVRKRSSVVYRAGVGVALAAVFILIWANGAVGIIGTENNSANLMYGGVFAIGVVGTILARLQPRGMARALYAMAFAQVVVAVIALAGGLGAADPSWPLDLLGLTAFFVALFVGSALLFQKAAQEQILAA